MGQKAGKQAPTEDGKGEKGKGRGRHGRKRQRERKQKGEGEYVSFTNELVLPERIEHEPTDDPNKFYDIKDQVLGVGNFSTVKLGIQKKTGKRCALKIVDKTLVTNKPNMLKNEVDILLRVDHPNIIHLVDLFDQPKALYLVMELVTGGELFDKIVEREQYSEEDAAGVMKQLFDSIKYLHGIGIVHRDLKPENLLLANDADDAPVKLADFGLSKIYTEDMMLSTACGTPGYVAPEILEAKPYTKAVDLWSCGVIMYILLCGYPPFYNESEAVLFENIMSGKFEFHKPYWDNISDSAKDLIKHLLVVDPDERYDADQALEHPWIKREKDKAAGKEKSETSIHHGFGNRMKKHNTFRKEHQNASRGKVRTEYAIASKK